MNLQEFGIRWPLALEMVGSDRAQVFADEWYEPGRDDSSMDEFESWLRSIPREDLVPLGRACAASLDDAKSWDDYLRDEGLSVDRYSVTPEAFGQVEMFFGSPG